MLSSSLSLSEVYKQTRLLLLINLTNPKVKDGLIIGGELEGRKQGIGAERESEREGEKT